MKKLFLILFTFVLYTSSVMPMARMPLAGHIAAIGFGFYPIILPSFYYYEQNRLSGGRKENNVFKGFVHGSLKGIYPGINFAELLKTYEEWVADNNLNETPFKKASKKGLFAGLSVYAAIPTAYRLLRFLKK